jgi:hypothetical protein
METKHTEQTVADVSASLLQPLEDVSNAAHQLANLIKPDVIPSGKHSHRIGEARVALAIATADLAATTAKFHRVSELLKSIED